MKFFAFAARHKIITGIAVLVLAGGGVYAYRAKKAASGPSTYTLAAVEKGTLVTSLSGSGQVSATDQLEVKAKVSGAVRTVSIVQGAQVKAGAVLVQLDSTDARKSVRDAETSLASAQLSYDKLVAPADALSLTQAENAVHDAERQLQNAKDALAQYAQTSVQDVASAYEDGYGAASDAFLDMPTHMNDLKNLRGTNAEAEANVNAFKIVLGQNSPLIATWLRDHDAALVAYNDAFAYFKTVTRSSDQGTRYMLISKTHVTELSVSQALQSAHAMLDATLNTNYKEYSIASTVDSSRGKILSDISQINADIAAMQRAKDTIDNNAQNGPITRKRDQDAIDAAQENLIERQQSLEKVKAGTDALDLKSAALTLQTRKNALADAYATLADYTVRAPFDGTIASFTLRKNDSVSSGTAVATMVTAQRFVNVTLNEVDAIRAKDGQKATLTFDAIEGLTISGQVATVDLLGTVSQGVVNYGVRILFDTQDDRVRPGMSASASIVTDVKTDVLLVPGSAVKNSGGASYVEMFDEHQSAQETTVKSLVAPRRQTVEAGGSNDTSTEIVSGLKEGDVIVTKTVTAAAKTTASTRTTTGFGMPGIGGTGGVRVQGAAGFAR